ncbi:hypothetical protein ABE504_18085 [Paenibacillus oryzisoli]|uniref:hypothetical protein n=1 Tax=Paenibacillus oryzisoli TaxID=1850517 RepID=UPI003D2898E2
MKWTWLLLAMAVVSLTACEDEQTNIAGLAAGSIPPLATAAPAPSALPDDGRQIDTSVRAVGSRQEGRLTVQPASQAFQAVLGAPSCYGLDTDIRWSGDYEAVWTTPAGDTKRIFAFPSDFEIIQPAADPVQMSKLTVDKAELFVFQPRYTDCHALETYLFGISEGDAFPIAFEMSADRTLDHLGLFPHTRLQVNRQELLWTGGYGAGQDAVEVYHFQYIAEEHKMKLIKTDKVRLEEVKVE